MKIEFDNVKVTIPESWKDIRLSDYEKWYMQKPQSRAELVKYVADVCNLDVEVLLNAPAQVFSIVSDTISFVFNQNFEPAGKCHIDGVDYHLSLSEKMTLGEYVDVEAVLDSESECKIAELLAILCRPSGERYDAETSDKRVEMFKNLTCDKALPLVSFFLFKKKKSDEILSHCSTVAEQANLFLRDTANFVENGVGIRQLPIWQRIRYSFLMKSLKRELSKFSDFSSIG